ncbi:uncharacterized protein LOC135828449 isoform X2 [Sycon ciliatum]|uniref:uncharacterized protein LOC135828449 isoform X2 n=1 Tax=Sycon ciliatum TaxID=27933 RepID=UPI0031F6C469
MVRRLGLTPSMASWRFVVSVLILMLLSVVSFTHSQPSSAPCDTELGVATGLLSSQLITASSSYSRKLRKPKGATVTYNPGDARLNTHIGYGGWSPCGKSKQEYWQVTFRQQIRIFKISTKGFKPRGEKDERYIKSFSIYISLDGQNFTKVSGPTGSTTFAGNSDITTVVNTTFTVPLTAVILRLSNFTVKKGVEIGLQVAVYGCKLPYLLSALQSCGTPLGMASGAIPNASITASSVDGPEFAAAYGRLGTSLGGGGWCGKKPIKDDTLIQVDLGRARWISAVATQGVVTTDRNDEIFVTRYTVGYQLSNSSNYTVLGNAMSLHEQEFTANNDGSTINKQNFAAAFKARYLTLSMFGVDEDTDPCLRMEIYGCDALSSSLTSTTLQTATTTAVQTTTSLETTSAAQTTIPTTLKHTTTSVQTAPPVQTMMTTSAIQTTTPTTTVQTTTATSAGQTLSTTAQSMQQVTSASTRPPDDITRQGNSPVPVTRLDDAQHTADMTVDAAMESSSQASTEPSTGTGTVATKSGTPPSNTSSAAEANRGTSVTTIGLGAALGFVCLLGLCVLLRVVYKRRRKKKFRIPSSDSAEGLFNNGHSRKESDSVLYNNSRSTSGARSAENVLYPSNAANPAGSTAGNNGALTTLAEHDGVPRIEDIRYSSVPLGSIQGSTAGEGDGYGRIYVPDTAHTQHGHHTQQDHHTQQNGNGTTTLDATYDDVSMEEDVVRIHAIGRKLDANHYAESKKGTQHDGIAGVSEMMSYDDVASQRPRAHHGKPEADYDNVAFEYAQTDIL